VEVEGSRDPAIPRRWRIVKKQNVDIAALVDEEGRAMESAPDVAVPASSVKRGNGRSKTLQVRLNPEEYEELERIAATRGLPTSTVAREAILRMVQPEASRTAAANRVIEEFTRYIDAIGDIRHDVTGDAVSSEDVAFDPEAVPRTIIR
jgi:predicted DNA-binding protein